MAGLGWLILLVVLLLLLAYRRVNLIITSVSVGVWLLLLTGLSDFSGFTLTVFWLCYLAVFVPLNMVPLRQLLISQRVLKFYRRLMPSMSDTEREALTAGGVGWIKDIFSGMPDYQKFKKIPSAEISTEEQEFLEGSVEKLCSMVNDWKISRTMHIPSEIWQHLKKDGYFAMIIPKNYGGREFSHVMHAQVLSKVACVSSSVASVIAVPNSLGPAELLLRYGTEDQKNYYLPRLARAEDIPCFALTSPVAGSDAGAIADYGIVEKAKFAGQEQLCIRLNWDKRYITLAPLATLLGLAFKLYDPDHLLGDKEYIGITCALIPTDTPGVVTGKRHYPLDSAFPNGPTQGKDVIVPVEWIIGGQKMAGRGWRMLMECLAAGRGISLPSVVTGASKKAALTTGAYARIRRQFNTYIGNFGGIEEALARIAGYTYMMEAMRLFTVAALDQGMRPVVASAISKYQATQLGRFVGIAAMDVHGGKGICMGPNNYLAQGYIESPISITVEGANILTRSMIIFGQGVMRCHPYLLNELEAALDSHQQRALQTFDRNIFGHIGFMLSNAVRSFLLGITNGRLCRDDAGPLTKYLRRFTRFSAALAFTSDMVILTLGAQLKIFEKISGRLADVLSYLYIGYTVLKYYAVHNGNQYNREELPVAEHVCQELLFYIEEQLDALLTNLPNQVIAKITRFIIMPFGERMKAPDDKLINRSARLLYNPSQFRRRLAEGTYAGDYPNNIIVKMERVLHQVIAAEPIEKKIFKAERRQIIMGKSFNELVAEALNQKIITHKEAQQVLAADAARMEIINVDSFSEDFFNALKDIFNTQQEKKVPI